MSRPKYMPIMKTPLRVRMDCLSEEQAQRNHSQSLETLARRGGLSICEVAALVRGERFDPEMKDFQGLVILARAERINWKTLP